MADLMTTFRLSKRASDVADSLAATGKFEDAMTAAKFAVGYALKNYFDEFDPAAYIEPDNDGHTYNVGSIDKDRTLGELMKALYPNIEDPFVCVKALMNFGLLKIGETIDEQGMPSIAELCE